ncbi:sigma-54-dependent transcriptional regulator [Cesiribacter andamanensis]|uniref:Transcriptional regulatory protein ZraR n=1 Tax=Cesiribacter andamanensis AMV16 TaxID=1279009 RepID=M7N8B5_9BACT|nr:sigma-54 dependent transcriptional regulator [Cesiribacter andamanensis]EMR03507.1 Transcriptional regulatory protein ZraR [Cesiribacter andamanensis AMV16]
MRIFIVEDDPFYGELLAYHLSQNPDDELHRFETGRDCLNHLYMNPSVICLDYSLPDLSGEEVLRKIKTANPDIRVVVISGQENIQTAIALLKLGATDYIVKDDDTRERLWICLNNLRQQEGMQKTISHLQEEVGRKYSIESAIIGNSPPIRKTFSIIEKAAASKITVSISGETGTGKELVAKAIHYNSPRRNRPFVAINITAIPKELIESELFGHEKGSFTGADFKRIGMFEEASGGTLFLDEVADMDPGMQAKLLRALQEMEIKRVGSNKPISIDVRLIVATHKNLNEEVRAGTFREDLYYRLLGLPIQLPPLRERSTDIILLARHFMKEYCRENHREQLKLSAEAQRNLLAYAWPGNVRELKAVIELACVMADGDTLESEHLQLMHNSPVDVMLSEDMTLKEYTHQIIKRYLEKYDRNVVLVAKKLDVGKSTIYRMLQDNSL